MSTEIEVKEVEAAVTFNVKAADIAFDLNDEQLVEFIKQLDDEAGTWDVTLALIDHFKKLERDHAGEIENERKREEAVRA